MALSIRPAVEADADALSALAARSKAHWGYSPQVLEEWRPQLSISADVIRSRVAFVAMEGEAVAGFYSLARSSGAWELDNFWVAPEHMRRGIGRSLLSHALAIAGDAGVDEVKVDSDPNAEPFYLACGAMRCGAVAAPIPGEPDRVRPQLSFSIAARGVAVRVFEVPDYDEARALWERTQGVGLSSADERDAICRFLARNPGLNFVAVDECIVGTILCGHDGRRGYIHHLAIASTHRRRGIAATLVRRALASLRREGIHKCHLFVHRSNDEGLAFWRGIGAEERVELAMFSMPTDG